jgi:hypothetical protein
MADHDISAVNLGAFLAIGLVVLGLLESTRYVNFAWIDLLCAPAWSPAFGPVYSLLLEFLVDSCMLSAWPTPPATREMVSCLLEMRLVLAIRERGEPHTL